MAGQLANRTHCNHGHEFTPENTGTRWKNEGRVCITCRREASKRYFSKKRPPPRDKKYCKWGHLFEEGAPPNCRTCNNLKNQDRRRQMKLGLPNRTIAVIMAELGVNAALVRAKLQGLPLDDLEEQMKKDSLQYLKLDTEGSKASDALNYQVDRTNTAPFCRADPAPWMDYEKAPTDAVAEEMCNGCPLWAECDRLAIATRPPTGVWAGQVWVEDVKDPRVGHKRSAK